MLFEWFLKIMKQFTNQKNYKCVCSKIYLINVNYYYYHHHHQQQHEKTQKQHRKRTTKNPPTQKS